MTANEKRSKTAKENAAKRREREDQDRREAEILKGYNL